MPKAARKEGAGRAVAALSRGLALLAGWLAIPAPVFAGTDLQNCYCVCAIDPGQQFCNVTQSCFYNPEPTCGSTPGCADPSRGECINTIGCSVPCNRTPYSYAFGAPGDNASTTALRAQCRQDCDTRFGGSTPTATRTNPPGATATRTQPAAPTPTEPEEVEEIACGQTVQGTLSDSDIDLFGDGTFADPYFFTLYEPTIVEFTMSAGGFDEFVWIADASNPNDYVPIFQGGSPQGGLLQPGEYVAVANNTYPIPPGSYPYSFRMDCETAAPSTATRTRTRTPTATATRTRTGAPVPTATRTGTRTATGTRTPTRRTPTRTVTPPPEVDRIACGQDVAGELDPNDEDYFGDGTWADLYDLHLAAPADVTVRMDGVDFLPYLLIFAAADPDSVITSAASSFTVALEAGDYVIVANNYYAVEPTTLSYTISVDCEMEPTATPTRTATRTETTAPTPIPTATWPVPTTTRTSAVAPTPTHTATPTATFGTCPVRDGSFGSAAGPGGCADLVADAIEVVQSVQDLNNSVKLVVGKRTFVRFHVHSLRGPVRATARLKAGQFLDDPLAKTLKPINPGGYITVTDQPDRRQLNAAFLFELPEGLTGFVDGDKVALEAEVNPGNELAESDFGNNTASTLESFRFVPTLSIALYHIGYRGVAAPGKAEPGKKDERYHADRLRRWLERAYPVPKVEMQERSYLDATGGLPSCESVTGNLASMRRWNKEADKGLPYVTYYYGMVFDRGDRNNFVRGSTPIPIIDHQALFQRVSCGPAGDPSNYDPDDTVSWDTDDSFADWSGGHEIGHAHLQLHPGVCDGEDVNWWWGAGPHHPNGRISAATEGRDAVFGFDAGSGRIYMPGAPDSWTDVMTYCDREWISDLTYHGLMERMRPRSAAVSAPLITIRVDGLLVAGSIDAGSGTVDVQPLFVLPASADPAEERQGDFAVVLRDAAGAELARYPFAPSLLEKGHGPSAGGGAGDTSQRLLFAELVPYVDGVARVDIDGPGVHATRSAGMAEPQVRVVAPNGGETVPGDAMAVRWTASDADGDPLVFNVEYSADDGESWELLAQGVTGSRVDIPTFDLVPSDAARVRVSASDGIHSGSDASDGPFTVANTDPEVEITAPADGATVASGQTVAFLARAFDRGTGTLPAERLEWRSNLDGVFGYGSGVSVSDLSVGRHEITCTADDADGGLATDRVTVVVVSDLAELPALCSGDCDGNGAVSINELVTGVAMALDTRPVADCTAMDADGDGRVSINDLVAAVRAALDGCTALSAPFVGPGVTSRRVARGDR